MLELSWQLCPYCASAQANYAPEMITPARQVRPASIPEDWAPPRSRPSSEAGRAAQPVEFIEGDEY